MYILTDTHQLSCHGMSFSSIAEARNYAFELKEQFGLCQSFEIGHYENGKYAVVYSNGNRDYSFPISIDGEWL